MTRTVLVPLDGSERSEQTLWHVHPLVERLGLRLSLLRCVAPAGDPDGDLARGVQDYVAGLANRLQGAGLTARPRVRRGDAAAEILAEVAATSPYLVALTSHGRGGVSRWVRGSVAERLLRRCPAPLLLCRTERAHDDPDAPPFRRIVVPLDGSARAEQVLPLVQDLARANGAQVALLRVGRRLDLAADDLPPTAESLTDSLEGTRARLEGAGVTVSVHGRFGDPAAEVVAHAEEREADLVAMTTHGRTGLARWLFGSVAEHVFHDFRAPLLVVRPVDLVGPAES